MAVPEKRLFFRGRGLIGTAILVPAFIAVLFSRPAADWGAWQSVAFFSMAWLCFILGASFRFWSTMYVGGRKRLSIVQEGPYSVCRNPLYLGSLFLALSIGLFLESLTFTVCVGMAMLIYLTFILPAEEADLRAIHGEAYDEYCRRVPRILPRFSLFSSSSQIEVSAKGLRLEVKRAVRWVVLPVICRVVVECRAQEWWPHWIRLW